MQACEFREERLYLRIQPIKAKAGFKEFLGEVPQLHSRSGFIHYHYKVVIGSSSRLDTADTSAICGGIETRYEATLGRCLEPATAGGYDFA